MRLRKRKYISARVVQGITNCTAPDNQPIKDIEAKISQKENEKAEYTALLTGAQALVGNVGKCGIGRKLKHWLDKYPKFKILQGSYGKSMYCEPNFVDATINILQSNITAITKAIQDLTNQRQQLQSSYDQMQRDYQSCLQSEAVQAVSIVPAAAATAQLTAQETAQTAQQVELVKAQTTQQQVTGQNDQMKTALMVGGGVLALGLVYMISQQ